MKAQAVRNPGDLLDSLQSQIDQLRASLEPQRIKESGERMAAKLALISHLKLQFDRARESHLLSQQKAVHGEFLHRIWTMIERNELSEHDVTVSGIRIACAPEEISQAIGCNVQTARDHLKILEEKGFLTVSDGRSRGNRKMVELPVDRDLLESLLSLEF